MKKKLREFVQSKWKPTQDDAFFNAEGRILALNFLDFLSEARGCENSMTLLILSRFFFDPKVWLSILSGL
jgi:hypothetical protein